MLADDGNVLDLDAFWAEQTTKTTPVKVLGEVVHLPAAGTLPLDLQRRLNEADANDEKALRPLLGELFGDEVLVDKWWESGRLTLRQLRMLAVWALANGQGRPLTLEQAQAVVDAQMDGDAGEAPRPAGRARKTSRSGSSKNSGRSSKPTSPASTS